MRIASPAKINLSLSVGSVRADGYHEVNSFFHLISLHDILTVSSSERFTVSTSVDLGIPEGENLVYKAAQGMAQIYKRDLPEAHFSLEKFIPHGAGLGGGSSNAAAAIFAISQLWDLDLCDPRHIDLAAELGSDVPLFLAPTTASVMVGRGELLAESHRPLTQMQLLIVMPKDAYSPTGAVYKAFDKDPQPTHKLDEWKNNLEKAATAVSPKTGEVLAWLRVQPEVDLAQVAGSGAACWAHIRAGEDSEETAKLELLSRRARDAGYDTYEAVTVENGIHIIA